MAIWKKAFTLKQLNEMGKHCAVGHLGIEISAYGENWIEAKMPVDHRTTQPFGLLHGGVSVALAETIGSLAGFLCIEEGQSALGLDINANHLRPVKQGVVIAKAMPISLSKNIHVWQIDIRDEQDKLCCVSRLTLSIKYLWYPLLKAIILPMRSKRIAQNYQSIWTEQGSPLLAITKQQQAGLQAYLNEKGINAQVEIAMTYGNPSMQSAVKNLLKNDVERIIVLPLYPQYSSTTTGALIDAFNRAIAQERNIVPFEFIHSYHLNENYINALVDSIKVRLKPDEFLLFSYHGIPLRYENMGDYYRQHCKQTTIAIVDKLGLTENQWNMTFQSRFGREEWLQPYTDHFLEEAASQGIQKIAVICPGFSVDCLETLEEIEVENKEKFLTHGGVSYHYIPALNAEKAHIEMMGELILDKLQ